MAVFIEIKKINEDQGVHYYHIPAIDDQAEFFMKIDTKSKEASFYIDSSFSNKIKTFTFENEKDLAEINGVKSWIAVRVIMQASKALRSNDFSADLSWIS